MPDLHFDFLVLVATAVLLVAALSLAEVFLSLDPWLEKLGGIEVALEVAEDVGGGDALRLVNS
jgi:hypothetical protein